MIHFYTEKTKQETTHVSSNRVYTLNWGKQGLMCMYEAKCTLVTKGRRRRGSIVKSAKLYERIWTEKALFKWRELHSSARQYLRVVNLIECSIIEYIISLAHKDIKIIHLQSFYFIKDYTFSICLFFEIYQCLIYLIAIHIIYKNLTTNMRQMIHMLLHLRYISTGHKLLCYCMR